ncbi:MAG: hypothetical protein ACR2JD_04680 [Nocardioides sp.]
MLVLAIQEALAHDETVSAEMDRLRRRAEGAWEADHHVSDPVPM